jgi:hypothetical protein
MGKTLLKREVGGKVFARKLTGFKWQETHEQETLTKYKIKKANVGGNVKRQKNLEHSSRQEKEN